MSRHIILEWGTDFGFLLHAILPTAQRIKLKVTSTTDEILTQIPGNTTTIWWHINLTRPFQIIKGFAELNGIFKDRGLRVVNGKVLNIGKASISPLIAAAGGRVPLYSENDWVIVKTDNNHSGMMDNQFSLLSNGYKGKNTFNLFNPQRYPVLKHDSIPPQWIDNRDVVVQRYVCNSAAYFARAYFLGNALVTSRAHSMADVKRFSEYIDRKQQAHLASLNIRRDLESDMIRQLNKARAALNIDYGTADLVTDDYGRYWVTDINPTPFWGDDQFSEITNVLKNDSLVRV